MANPERRLNQLLLVDETAFGLLLVWLYMVLDATQQDHLGAHWLTRLMDGNAEHPQWSAVANAEQVGLMLGLAGLIGYCRLHRLLRRVRPKKLSEVDAAFDDSAGGIAQRMFKRRPLFLATANLTDLNACCVLSFPRQYVIVGGGLRLLWRKAPAQAGGIIAHECMHLAKRDTLLLIGTWYTFIAYCLLLGIDLVRRQWEFWGKLAELIPVWREVGLDVFSGILRNLLVSQTVGFPSLVSALVVGVFLRHMMRLREFFADEGAAQQGHRQGIADHLMLASRHESPTFRLFRSFHPSARDRLERVAAGEGWGRVDGLFCLAGGLIISRLLAALPAPADISCPGPSGNQDIWSAFVACMQADVRFLFVGVLYSAILVSMCFLIVHHAYRTIMTRRARRCYWGDTVQAVCEVWAFAALGAILGELTTTSVLIAAGNIFAYDVVPPTESFDHAVASAISVAIVLLQLVVACSIVVRFTARRFHPSKVARMLEFAVFMVAALVLSYPLLNVPMMLIYEFAPPLRLGEHVAGWDRATTAIMHGTPNPAEVFLYCATLVLASAAISHILTRVRGGKPYLPGDLHRERLLPDSEWPQQAIAMSSAGTEAARMVGRRWAPLSASAAAAGVAVVLALLIRPDDPPASARPVKFSFNYPYGALAGTRSWVHYGKGLWSETYPDGKTRTTFREAGRMRHAGCGSTIVERQDVPSFKILIPDKGCKTMWLWVRSGEEDWQFLGVMQEVD